MDILCNWLKNYKKAAFINTKVGDEEVYREITDQFAAEKGWEYEAIADDTGLIHRLLNGGLESRRIFNFTA